MGKPKVRHNRTSTKGKTFPAGRGGMKILRKKSWKCPRCERMTKDYPAISRRDSKIEICSRCGTEEAMYDFLQNGEGAE